MNKTFVYENKALSREAHVSGIYGEYRVECFDHDQLAETKDGFDSLLAAERAALAFTKGEKH